jgi:integrase
MIPGVGRLKKVTGTHDPQINDAIPVMIDQLVSRQQLQPLRDVSAGKVTLLQLYDRWKEGDGKPLSMADEVLPALSTLRDWIAIYDKVNPKTRESYDNVANQLGKFATKNTTVADFPDLLKTYKKNCQKQKTARSFNIARNVLRSFLKNTMGKNSALYHAIEDIEPLNETVKRKPVILSPAELRALTDKLPAKIGQMVWTLATTGMEVNTYFLNRFEVLADRVLVHGEKQAHKDNRRDRIVPLVLDDLARPTVQLKAFRRAIRKVHKTVTVYDMRRCFAHWLYEAGINEVRIEQYGGWQAKEMARKYAKGAIDKYIVEDAEKIRAYVEASKAIEVNPHFAEFFETVMP